MARRPSVWGRSGELVEPSLARKRPGIGKKGKHKYKVIGNKLYVWVPGKLVKRKKKRVTIHRRGKKITLNYKKKRYRRKGYWKLVGVVK